MVKLMVVRIEWRFENKCSAGIFFGVSEIAQT